MIDFGGIKPGIALTVRTVRPGMDIHDVKLVSITEMGVVVEDGKFLRSIPSSAIASLDFLKTDLEKKD